MKTPKIAKRLLILASLGALTLFLQSCVVAVAAAVGAAYYMDGDLSTHVNGQIVDVVAATNGAARDLNLQAVSKTGDENKAKMVARRDDGEKVVIKLTPGGTGVTKVQIRIGTWGEEDYSRRILRAIERYL